MRGEPSGWESYLEQNGEDIFFGHGAGVLGGVFAYPTKRPRCGFTDLGFLLVHECVFEGFNTLGGNDPKCHLFVEASDEAQGGDSREPGRSLGVSDVLDQGLLSTGVGNLLG